MKAALHVVKPAVVSRILTLTGVHRHVAAALLEEMQDVRDSASENSETELRYSRCTREGGMEAPVLWERVAKCVLWKAELKWKAKGWRLPFGGEKDDEYVLRGLMWADHHHAARNKFERDFGFFLELISRFELDFRRCGNYFFERFEFLVCSKFNHTQCGRTCACAVACLCPHNSISNVVSLMIHDKTHVYNFYI